MQDQKNEIELMKKEKQDMNMKLEEFSQIMRDFQQNQRIQQQENGQLKIKIDQLENSKLVDNSRKSVQISSSKGEISNQQYSNKMYEEKAMTVGNLSNPQYSRIKETLTSDNKNTSHNTIETGQAIKHGVAGTNTSMYLNSHNHTQMNQIGSYDNSQGNSHFTTQTYYNKNTHGIMNDGPHQVDESVISGGIGVSNVIGNSTFQNTQKKYI